MPQKEKNLQFLGLGSVIDINHMEALLDTFYVIVARAVGKDKEGNTILYSIKINNYHRPIFCAQSF